MKRFHWIFIASVASTGCIKSVAEKHEDYDALINAYRRESAAAEMRHDSLLQAQVRSIDVRKAGGDSIALVSVDVHEAPLAAVVERIIQQSDAPVVFQKVALRGRATARFTNIPLLSALNELISAYGYRARMENGVVLIDYGSPPNNGDPNEVITVKAPINYMQGERVDDVLRSLLPSDRVRYAYQRATSTVTLIGKRQDISESLGLLRQADQEAPHVFIEALVVEFDRQALERYGIDLTEISIGNYTQVAALFGELGSDAISGKRTYGTNNNKGFTAFINALSSIDEARVLARPYVTTRSGEDAVIDIGTEQTIVVQGIENSNAVATTRDVSAGVTLHITPWVLPADEVRMGIDVTESAFLPVSGTAAAIRNKNHATTVTQVPSGKTVVIGGLAYHRRTRNNAGAPFLQKIPLLNLFFSNQQATERNEEVVVFITPHIWTPSMDPPLSVPDAFSVQKLQTKKSSNK